MRPTKKAGGLELDMAGGSWPWPRARPHEGRLPIPARSRPEGIYVSLRELKSLVEGLEPSNPLRIMVLGEPDEVSRAEYGAKIVTWFRLLLTWGGSAPPDVR